MKKIIIGIVAVLGIILLFLGYRVYSVYSLYNELVNLSESDYDGRIRVEFEDGNFPDYLIKFWADQEKQFQISDLISLIPERDNLFQKEATEKLIETATPLLSNDLDRFKEIVPVIKNKMNEEKKSIAPTYKESENYYSSPTFKTMRYTARYWSIVSRLLEHKKDYETSLYLSHAIFYLSKDFETDYLNSSSLINKIISMAITEIACDSIMIWASRPKPQCRALSKEIAKDILDFVKNEYPLSVNIEYDSIVFEEVLNYLADKGRSSLFYKARNSSSYDELFNKCFNEPKKLFDKPIYEIKKEMDKYSEEHFKMANIKTIDYIFYAIFNPGKGTALFLLGMGSPDFSKSKKEYEARLAKMEITAIALAINSFVCEKKKYPKSMSELSQWFGSELPNNRITNEPYELDFEGEHVIYNKSVTDKEIFFDFSIK